MRIQIETDKLTAKLPQQAASFQESCDIPRAWSLADQQGKLAAR
jgi:hypothetical protein